LRRPPSTAGHSRAARTDRGQTPADRLSAYGQFFADQRRHVGVCSKSRQCHTRRRLFAACRHVTRRAPFVGSIPIRSCRFGRRRQLGQPVDDPPARLAVHESAACRASGAANAQIVGHYRFPLSELCGYRRCDLCRCLLHHQPSLEDAITLSQLALDIIIAAAPPAPDSRTAAATGS
jgi:hypothetical protein